jgi:hypothetical protein
MTNKTPIDLYNGEVRIWFEKRGHTYTHDDGSVIANPSSVLRLVNKPFLVKWAAKKATEFIEEEFQPYTEYNPVEIARILRGAKVAHEEYSSDRMQIGTQVHAYVEQRIKYELGLRKTQKRMPPSSMSDIYFACLAFEDFVWRYKPVWQDAERVVYSRKNDHVGTTDAVCMIDGEFYIVDWKTGSGLYLEHAYQMASYLAALKEEEPEKHAGTKRLLVRLSTNGKFVTYWDEDIKKKLTGQGPEEDYEQFLRLLAVWRTIQQGPQAWSFR